MKFTQTASVILFIIAILFFPGCSKTDEIYEQLITPSVPSSIYPVDETLEPSILPSEPPKVETAIPVPEETENLNETDGIFKYIEWGDYLHLYMADTDGAEMSFFVLKYPGYDVETLTEGQKIKVFWRNVDIFLDSPQEMVNLNELVKIEPVGD